MPAAVWVLELTCCKVKNALEAVFWNKYGTIHTQNNVNVKIDSETDFEMDMGNLNGHYEKKECQ